MLKTSEIQKLAMNMPVRSRIKLASDLLKSTAPSWTSEMTLTEAIRREEEITSGKVKPLSEDEFWQGIRKR